MIKIQFIQPVFGRRGGKSMKRISALIIAVLSAVVFGSCSLISNHYYQQNESGSSAVNSKPAVNSATAIESQTVKEDHATTAPVTDNPQSTPNENAAVFNDTAPFYGIWVYASKSYDEAKNFANDVSSNGFNGYTENTTHWSNLNDEEWNVVTAGKYATETEAVNQLSKVKEKYPDAYVKYSGEYQLTSGDGDPAFYGIWVYASKSYDEAASFAGVVSSTGLNGVVIVTTDWSNLNSEKWYVVTAGQYETENEANDKLNEVQAYYPDAYVKYSGNHINN